MRSIKDKILMLLLFLLSIGLMTYPYISNYIYENSASSIVDSVEKEVEKTSDEKTKKMLEDAKVYNEYIASGHVKLTDPFIEDKIGADFNGYNSLLNFTEDGFMGSVSIPSINVHLPIYHGTSNAVLEKGAGHLQGTSLPVGGKSTHAVITGHSGLSNAKLFTDLEQLKVGDYFFINVCGEKLAYKVDNISKVLPEEMSKLTIVPEMDYCTLVTCTPYGINTHRLLVRGIRTDYKEAVKTDKSRPKKVDSRWMREYKRALLISFSVFFVCLFIYLIYRRLTGGIVYIDDFI